ncbi:CGNR zinc finger domain-containing protein [Ktedonosporobacter rubrisoli]|nr:ABATE domain-containing protein [Ktedonosporobacter rubrisoli]
MNTSKAEIETLRLLGGRLCLDFANTMDPRLGNHPCDYLRDYSDLLQWSLHVGLLAKDEAEQLQENAAQRPVEAATTFEQAITLRETLYRIFSTLARNAFPEKSDLDNLKAMFVRATTHAQLIPATHGLQWDWTERAPALAQMLWPVVHSAIELLTSEEVKKVKECPGVGDCGWLFLDTSKNGSRQWCSMEGCGSRAKMRRQYARKRANSSQHIDSA